MDLGLKDRVYVVTGVEETAAWGWPGPGQQPARGSDPRHRTSAGALLSLAVEAGCPVSTNFPSCQLIVLDRRRLPHSTFLDSRLTVRRLARLCSPGA